MKIISHLLLQILWRKRLRHKFQNSRRRKDFCHETVVNKKRKFKSSEGSIKKPVHGPSSKQYLPEKPEGEDDASVKKHIEWMQTESKMRQKGKEVLKKVEFCMERTLHYRRQLTVIDGVPISDILEQFPWLKGPGLLKEFSRISVANIVQELLQFLSDYGECLLKKVNNSKTEVDGVLKELIENAHKTKENEKYVASCIALLGVSFLLGENCSNIVRENAADAQLAPVFIRYIGEFITCTDFDILIDSVVVFEGGGILWKPTRITLRHFTYTILSMLGLF